jgi:hypothetical protein
MGGSSSMIGTTLCGLILTNEHELLV